MRQEQIIGFLYWFWLVLLLLANVLPISSSLQNQSQESSEITFNIRIDFIFHFVGFMILPIASGLKHLFKNKVFSANKADLSILFSLSAAILFELFQLIISYRTFNIKDMLMNIAGVSAGYLLMFLVIRKVSVVKEKSISSIQSFMEKS